MKKIHLSFLGWFVFLFCIYICVYFIPPFIFGDDLVCRSIPACGPGPCIGITENCETRGEWIRGWIGLGSSVSLLFYFVFISFHIVKILYQFIKNCHAKNKSKSD